MSSSEQDLPISSSKASTEAGPPLKAIKGHVAGETASNEAIAAAAGCFTDGSPVNRLGITGDHHVLHGLPKAFIALMKGSSIRRGSKARMGERAAALRLVGVLGVTPKLHCPFRLRIERLKFGISDWPGGSLANPPPELEAPGVRR